MAEKINKEPGKLNPSPEWTQEDRNDVLVAIAIQMIESSRPLATKEEVVNWAQRIIFVTIWKSEALELNRENILEGLTLPPQRQ